MIKKSLFEDELIHGMQRELQLHEKKQGMNNLVKAADYLQSAAEIFEEAGLSAKADQVIGILAKIAVRARDTNAKEMPAINLHKLMEHGVLPSDLQDLRTDPTARARVSTAYRKMGYMDKEILSILGDNYMSEEDARDMLDPKWMGHRFMQWMKDPTSPIDPENPTPSETFQQNVTQWMQNPGPPDEIKMQSVMEPKKSPGGTGEDLVFKSIAQELGLLDDNDANGKPRRPKNPTKIHDPHTKGLTPEKMVENLKHHGTEFNMADDGIDSNDVDFAEKPKFKEFYKKYMEHKEKGTPVTDLFRDFKEEDELPPTVRPSNRPAPAINDLFDDIPMDGSLQVGEADDMLDANINTEEPLVVHEHDPDKTFEDSH